MRLNCYLENFELSATNKQVLGESSTADQVAYFSRAIKDASDNREVQIAVFVDLKSTYDFFWRELLINELSIMGVN